MSPQQDATKSDSTSTGDELSLRKHKTVAIDTSQNASFTHRLLPAQSPEFDNVINQVIQYISVYFSVYFCVSQYTPVYSCLSQYILVILFLQARVDRMEFGGSQPVKAKMKQNVPLRYSHFVSLESNDILQAATADLVKIFQLKVCIH